MNKTKKLTRAILGTVVAASLTLAPVALAADQAHEHHADCKHGTYTRPETVTDAQQALKLLEEGNARFVSGHVLPKDLSRERRADLAQFGQKPFAVIVSCSDSRVPPELIFDQALGDLFVIRVAGNVLDAIGMGSVEYAVEHLHAPLIVVLGHEKCGAVKASLDGGEVTENIAAIAGKIKPAIDNVQSGQSKHVEGNNTYEAVTEENVDGVVASILSNPVLHHMVAEQKVQVIGAKYYQEEGTVKFFETAAPEHH